MPFPIRVTDVMQRPVSTVPPETSAATAATRCDEEDIGSLVAGLISAALARLPGVTIYVSQDLSFLAPVDIGDRVRAVCEVVNALDGNKFTLTTDVVADDGTTVIEGQAVVLVDEPPQTNRVESEALA